MRYLDIVMLILMLMILILMMLILMVGMMLVSEWRTANNANSMRLPCASLAHHLANKRGHSQALSSKTAPLCSRVICALSLILLNSHHSNSRIFI